MWQAFAEESTPQQPPPADNTVKSVRTRNGKQNKQGTQVNSGFESWGFGAENFTAVPAGSSQTSRPIGAVNKSRSVSDAQSKHTKSASQPAGWAGF